MLSPSCFHHEFNPLHRSRGIFVDQGQITRRQVDEFPPPSRVRNFHPQNAVGKTQRPSPVSHRTAARDGPRQKRTFACRRAMKSSGDDGFEAGGSAVQGMTPDSRTRWGRDDCSIGKCCVSYDAAEAAAAAAFARFLAILRWWAAEYRLPRQRRAPHKQGASSSPS